ncbi:hypothetical protein ACPV3S_15825 [Photobacterium damselae]|uniref:hypothetical protein n=1 Tax=Photobacterium damselae TaxID=38293 RepID=UPI0040696EE5
MQFFKFRVLADNLVIYEKAQVFPDLLAAQTFITNKFPLAEDKIIIFGANSAPLTERTDGVWL